MEVLLDERPRIDEFITNAFNYYNGRINTFNNKARLIIDWINHWNDDIGGSTRNPDLVMIYPSVIFRNCNSMYYVYYNILVTIIHELYHIDQNIDYIRYVNDSQYSKMIENAVEIETYLYIANHQHELSQVFGFDDRIYFSDYNKVIRHFEIGARYVRRTYETHMESILSELTMGFNSKVIKTFHEAFNDITSDIDVWLNDMQFYIKKADLCMPIGQLNDILFEECFKYNLRGSEVDMFKHISKNEYVLRIQTSCANFMCKIWR